MCGCFNDKFPYHQFVNNIVKKRESARVCALGGEVGGSGGGVHSIDPPASVMIVSWLFSAV